MNVELALFHVTRKARAATWKPASIGPQVKHFAFTGEDWRVHSKWRGARLTSYCSSHGEALNCVAHLSAIGYHSLEIVNCTN